MRTRLPKLNFPGLARTAASTPARSRWPEKRARPQEQDPHGVALRRGDGDGLQFAHLDLTLNGLHQLEYELHLPRPQAGHRDRRAAVGNVRDVKTGSLLHHLAGEMLGRTNACAAEIKFSGTGAHRS